MDKRRVRQIFDAIAPRYDLANDVLSLGWHRRWERRAVRRLELRPGARLLDLGAGSGRTTRRALSNQPRLRQAFLVDLSCIMLGIARRELAPSGRAHCVCGDGEGLPLRGESVDAAILAYCLRNIPDPARAVAELHRVLRPGGRLVILEFSTPTQPLFAGVYLFYLRRILPLLGGLLTGHRDAYEHLRDSIGEFPDAGSVRRLLEATRFRLVECAPLTLGIATLYVADRL